MWQGKKNSGAGQPRPQGLLSYWDSQYDKRPCKGPGDEVGGRIKKFFYFAPEFLTSNDTRFQKKAVKGILQNTKIGLTDNLIKHNRHKKTSLRPHQVRVCCTGFRATLRLCLCLNCWLREFPLSVFANRFELRCELKQLMLLYYKICPCLLNLGSITKYLLLYRLWQYRSKNYRRKSILHHIRIDRDTYCLLGFEVSWGKNYGFRGIIDKSIL